MYRNVLLPLDGTEFSEHEVEHALHVVAPDGVLTMLHVLPTSPLVRFPSEALTSSKVGEELQQEHESRLKYLKILRRRILHRRRDLRVEIQLSQGDLETTIVSVATDLQADLVVLAQAHRSLFERILKNSTTESLLQKLSVPALVVHGPPSTRIYQAWSGLAVLPRTAYT